MYFWLNSPDLVKVVICSRSSHGCASSVPAFACESGSAQPQSSTYSHWAAPLEQLAAEYLSRRHVTVQSGGNEESSLTAGLKHVKPPPRFLRFTFPLLCDANTERSRPDGGLYHASETDSKGFHLTFSWYLLLVQRERLSEQLFLLGRKKLQWISLIHRSCLCTRLPSNHGLSTVDPVNRSKCSLAVRPGCSTHWISRLPLYAGDAWQLLYLTPVGQMSMVFDAHKQNTVKSMQRTTKTERQINKDRPR